MAHIGGEGCYYPRKAARILPTQGRRSDQPSASLPDSTAQSGGVIVVPRRDGPGTRDIAAFHIHIERQARTVHVYGGCLRRRKKGIETWQQQLQHHKLKLAKRPRHRRSSPGISVNWEWCSAWQSCWASGLCPRRLVCHAQVNSAWRPVYWR